MAKTPADVECLLPSHEALRSKRSKPWIFVKHAYALLGVTTIAALSLYKGYGHCSLQPMHVTGTEPAVPCVQVAPLVPKENGDLWKVTAAAISSESFKERAVSWLGGAVQIP